MAVGGLLAVRKLVYSVDVAHYTVLIQEKFFTNCNIHLTKSIFQKHSKKQNCFFGTVIHDEEQRAQADADGTQVGAFVDLEQCMDLVAVG